MTFIALTDLICPLCSGDNNVYSLEEFDFKDAKCSKCHTIFSLPVKILEGTKNDQGKPRLELIPPFALEEVAKVMEFGAEKHGLYSYLEGFSWCEMVGGILRHVYKFLRGEDKDDESGLSHLAHAAARCLIMVEYIKRGIGNDDRYK